MKILCLAVEVAPFVAVGGLSQVMYFLPKALIKKGNDVRVFTPLHGGVNRKYTKNFKKKVETLWSIDVPISNEINAIDTEDPIACNVYSYNNKKGDAHIYFLENSEYFGLRTNVFGYADDHIRFALYSKACLEWLSKLQKDDWKPDIIHCHDWHSAYFIEMARKNPKYKSILKKIPIVLTVHNFKYQGNADFRYVTEDNKDRLDYPLANLNDPLLQFQNPLMRGLFYADAINTVSPTHAIEVLTPEYAEGLDEILHKVKGKLTGILNGLDIKEFNPLTDPNIKSNYSAKRFKLAREQNKKDLQKAFKLPVDPKSFVIAYAGRLASQKGLDLILSALPRVLAEKPETQFVVLGKGDDQYRKMFTKLKDLFPKQVGLYLFSDFTLPRKIFAGADLQLIPSIFEPGGIVALEAMRYGAIPLVRTTGGLADIVEDFDADTNTGNGFSFQRKDAWSLYGAIIEALALYQQPEKWFQLVTNAMTCDFSWDHVADQYIDWYAQSIKKMK